MELTLAQLQEITLGALRVEETVDGFRFYRLTPSQTAAFTRANETFEGKCYAAAGIRLDFETDSDLLAVRWHQAQVTTRRFCFFDVLVDGELMLHSGTLDCGSAPEGNFCFALPEGIHRVQIFLPALVGICLRSVTLSEGAVVIPCRPAKRILLHGDSITQGYDALFPSGSYANIVARYYDAELVNQAVGGACYNEEVLEQVGEFDFALVACGANDWTKKTPETFELDADAFFKKLKALYPTMPVYVILPIWRADEFTRGTITGNFQDCRALLGTLAERQGFTVLDDYDLVTHDVRLFSDRRIHPNDAGFALYGQRLIELLAQTQPK